MKYYSIKENQNLKITEIIHLKEINTLLQLRILHKVPEVNTQKFKGPGVPVFLPRDQKK